MHHRIVSVVDDDASIRRSLRNLLSSVGFQVETFESAEAFLATGDLMSADCLVLDMRMPGMSGLDLLSHLVALGSPRRVIMLTARPDAETRQRSLRMGAVAFLEKPFESTALLDAVERSMPSPPQLEMCEHGWNQHVDCAPAVRPRGGTDRRPIHFARGTLGKHRHIGAFFSSADEEHRVLRSFISDGLAEGDASVHIVDPALREDYLQRLTHGGIDVECALGSGQLEVTSWHDAYLPDGCFKQDVTLALVEETLHSRAAAGRPLTRLVAHMDWALLDRPGVEDLLEYETRANYMLPKYDDAVICVYDTSKFPADLALDIMRTHPMVIIGGVLYENPFFVPPDEFLAEVRERRWTRKSVRLVS